MSAALAVPLQEGMASSSMASSSQGDAASRLQHLTRLKIIQQSTMEDLAIDVLEALTDVDTCSPNKYVLADVSNVPFFVAAERSNVGIAIADNMTDDNPLHLVIAAANGTSQPQPFISLEQPHVSLDSFFVALRKPDVRITSLSDGTHVGTIENPNRCMTCNSRKCVVKDANGRIVAQVSHDWIKCCCFPASVCCCPDDEFRILQAASGTQFGRLFFEEDPEFPGVKGDNLTMDFSQAQSTNEKTLIIALGMWYNYAYFLGDVTGLPEAPPPQLEMEMETLKRWNPQ